MTSEITHTPFDQPEPLPFPFSQQTYCRYERIEQRIGTVRVLVVNDLLHEESDLSDIARREWGEQAAANLARERDISGMALDNILSNVERLVRHPVTEVAHVSKITEAAADFRPQAVVLSGTLSDFDYYNPKILDDFRQYIQATRTPVLGICGGHQLVGLSFGARICTLDDRDPRERPASQRPFEYQYRFIKITEPEDLIFQGIDDRQSGIWQDYTIEARILRVWQNHGLQLDRVPEGFRLLATSYLCKNQMMVRRGEGQLIYTVQFHLEKSFQDLTKSRTQRISPNATRDERRRLLRQEASNRTRWAHQNESRDGRIIFENFLREALLHEEESN